jgi:hypothetical protein
MRHVMSSRFLLGDVFKGPLQPCQGFAFTQQRQGKINRR